MAIPTETFSPAPTHGEALRRACHLWGVQEEYWDIFGAKHITSPEVQQTILESLGVPAADKQRLDEAIEDRMWQRWSRLAAPTLVLTAGDGLSVSLPANYGDGEILVRLDLEDGSGLEFTRTVPDLSTAEEAELRGVRFVSKTLPLPPSIPLGYHTAHFTATAKNVKPMETTSRLILCPKRAYKPDFLEHNGKAGGVAVSLYGLRSGRNWGCGDFTDLEALTDWMAESVKASFIALNPLHSIPNRQPYNTSPYLPNSSFYRNPLYLDVESLEDVRRCPLAQRMLAGGHVRQRLSELRAAPFVEYEKVYDLKLRFLKLGFRQFLRESSERQEEFRRFVESEGELLDKYALFCALDEVIHKQNRDIWIWPDWPEHYKDPNSRETAEFARRHERRILFHKYLQWQIDIQLAGAQRHALERGLKIGLYHDLALATDRCGSDLWAHRPFYVDGCRVGSPPDDFSPAGQDWAFPPPNSLKHQEDGYRLFAASIRKNAKHGGALRIDHVMRFFRLFWIPDGKDARSGVYVRDFSEQLLRILALESVRDRFIVIGEDLGTVEPYIREALHEFGILSYRLLYFEKHEDGTFRTPAEYPRQALVSVSTHDLPTLSGFWTSSDIYARRAAGILPDQASLEAHLRDRAAEKQKMMDLFFHLNLLPQTYPRRAEHVPEFSGELHNAAVGFLALTPSELMVLNQEDLFKDTDQQNLPGTTEQYPNWRHKMRYRLEDLRTNEVAVGCTRMLYQWLEQTGRLN